MKTALSKTLLFISFCCMAYTGSATVRTVTSATDMAPGCLRNTVYAAAASDTITFAIRGRVYVDSVIRIGKYLVILGPGADSLTYDARYHGVVLYVITPTNGYISGLGFAHGINTGFQTGSYGGCLCLDGVSNVVRNCKFLAGICSSNGGGVGAAGDLIMSGCTFDSCSISNTYRVQGGAAYCHKGMISDCIFTNNQSSSYGGALSTFGGEVSNCTFAGNKAGWGGAMCIIDDGYSTWFPGVHIDSKVSNCTFTANRAYYSAGTSVYQSIIIDTSIYINNTFTGDSQTYSNDRAIYALFTLSPGSQPGIGLLVFQNNILAAPGKNLGYDPNSTYGNNFRTLGGNICSDTSMPFLVGPHDMKRTNARLDTAGGLAYHGGTTPTIALLCSSPAINAGIDSAAPPTDQRGYPRVAAPDAGAYEYQRLLPIVNSQATTICAGAYYQVGLNSYGNTGIYTDTLRTTGGCDSIVVTDLTVRPAILRTVSIDTCAPYSITVGTHTHSASGTYMDTLRSVTGCDSVIQTMLHLYAPDSTIQYTDMCTGDSLRVGSHVYYTAGTYTDMLHGRHSCDSTVISHISVYTPAQHTASVDLCLGDSVHIGSHTYSNAGTYVDTLSTIHGCDSIVTTSIVVLTIDTQVANTGTTLTAVAANGKTYQWINCGAGNTPVTGATAQSFNPVHSGSYAVKEMQNGCTATSSCHAVVVSGIEEQGPAQSIHIYPNPAHQYVTISMGDGLYGGTARLLDIYGRQLATYAISGDTLTIDMSSYAIGVYQLEMIDGEHIMSGRILKE